MRFLVVGIGGFLVGCVSVWIFIYIDIADYAQEEVDTYLSSFEGESAAKGRMMNSAFSFLEKIQILKMDPERRSCEVWSRAQADYESLESSKTHLLEWNAQVFDEDVALAAVVENTLAEFRALPKEEQQACNN